MDRDDSEFSAAAEAKIASRLRQCLPGYAERIKPDQRIADLGFDSFDLVELLCLIEEEFRVRLADEDFFESKTVGDIIRIIANSGRYDGIS